MIVSIASGKGGTGKTLVATSLALSLKDKYQVQLLDCDVESPNDHIFLKPVITSQEAVCIPVPEVDEVKCTHCGQCAEVCAYNAIAVLPNRVIVLPELCHGCGACSHLCPEKAISETGREMGVVEPGHADGIEVVQGRLTIGEAMATPVIRQVKEKANSNSVVIIDVPPGTSCPVVESIKGSHFCLLVTEPTPFGLNDLTLAVETVRELDIPLAVVLNRVGVGDNKVAEYCRKENMPILLTIPLDSGIARLYSKGISLAEGRAEWRERFIELFHKIEEMIDEGTGSLKR
ncbi:MAG: P-loop NTPase [Dehalococcoidia bacterium]|nr:P-loop NTPase [Dehalococcoidia bacterium]